MNKNEKYLPLINRSKEIKKSVADFQSNELLKSIPFELSFPERTCEQLTPQEEIMDRMARRIARLLDTIEDDFAQLSLELGHAEDLAKQLDIEW
ncbi:hypothetical protein OGZ51_07215 [Lactococcus lactis]|uniref:Uncharacterized protein n=1 Tax=Lactococcus lactis TaxID=1358 RepID=A0A9X4S4E3_9LACT|nr:hypothetical protein [Lactococcus lactis]MDG4983930.1 hypothetical protein [Lactococcus lactis]